MLFESDIFNPQEAYALRFSAFDVVVSIQILD